VGSLELQIKNMLKLNAIHTFSHMKELKNKLELEMLNNFPAMTKEKVSIRSQIQRLLKELVEGISHKSCKYHNNCAS
jgi:hypothetical protein